MNPLYIGILAIICYAVSSALLIKDSSQRQSSMASLLLGWAAVFFHLAYTAVIFLQQDGLDFGFFSMGSTISSIIALLLLLVSLRNPIAKLGVAIFPLAGLMLVLTLVYTNTEQPIFTDGWQMNTHIFSSIIAFSLLAIAALQAIFLSIQNQQLRKHPPRKIILSLPALQTIESLLFQLISAGVIFLTVSLITGFIFIENVFAQHLVHKTLLSIVAWLVFSTLLYGRSRYGWRGQTAIQWTLIGFTSLLLAYFGSKFVLELILQKTT